MFYIDWTYIVLVMPALILAMAAQGKVSSTFNKYSRVQSHIGITGAEAARRIMEQNGIYDVSIERVSGNLTDHYDPSRKVLRLSDSVYSSSSIAAIGVAAHETGHAIQHAAFAEELNGSFGQYRFKTFNAVNIDWPFIQFCIKHGRYINNTWNNIFRIIGSIYYYNASCRI